MKIFSKKEGFTPTLIKNIRGFSPWFKFKKKLHKRFGFLIRNRNKKKIDFSLVWGFTTTELLVGVALFTVASTVMTTIFISAIKNQRLLQQMMAVNNNTGLVLEQIAREARTGYDFLVQTGEGECALGGSELSFINGQDGMETKFYLAENQTLVRQFGEDAPIELTASNVAVRKLCFVRTQYEDDACNPERVTILMEVAPREVSSTTLPIHIQTSVSSRVLPREIVGDPHECRTQ
jgi:type II secretory pathway pseudopilin PulG